MSKELRNALIIVGIVIVLFIIIFVIYQIFQTKPINVNAVGENVLDDANTGLDNMLNEIFDENIENTQNESDENVQEEEPQNTENKEENKQEENNTSSTNNSSQTDKNSANDNGMTTREKKAIELAKNKWKQDGWGSLDDVSFNVSIQSDGKYGVTVYDITTTASIQFYIVDVDNQTVEER